MRVTAVVSCTLCVLVFATLSAFAQMTGPAADQDVKDPQYGELDLGRPDQLTGGAPVPSPIEPSPPGPGSGRFELAGTTSRLMPANAGVLNFTLACQQEFSGSRVCTVAEVQRTVDVPEFTIETHAWILPDRETAASFHLDCDGWMSNAPGSLGLTVVVGPTSDCSGGLVGQSCSSPLSVACCAGG